jgi:hypothetical protein
VVWTTPHRRRTGTLARETNPTVAERELAKLDEVRATTKPDMTASGITPDHPIPSGPAALRATRADRAPEPRDRLRVPRDGLDQRGQARPVLAKLLLGRVRHLLVRGPAHGMRRAMRPGGLPGR